MTDSDTQNVEVAQTDVEDMSTEDLREEYQTYDLYSIDTTTDLWDRHLAIWTELESRDLVDFPTCKQCGAETWRFEVGGPPSCAECGWLVDTAQFEQRVQNAAQRLIHGCDDDE